MNPMPHPQASDPASTPGRDAFAINPLTAIRMLRSASGALIAQLGLHGQLVSVEWAEEKARLTGMLTAGLLGFAALLCLMLFGGVLSLAFSWDTPYRGIVATVVMMAYALVAGIAFRKLSALTALGTHSFSATREELAADIAMIRARL